MIVKIYGKDFECDNAIKGSDYIIFIKNGIEIRRDSGITDFGGYVITSGSWSIPEPTAVERIAALEDALLMLI